MTALRLPVLLLLLLAVPSGSALASSVGATSIVWQPETSKDHPIDETTVSWRAAPGERNDLDVTIELPRTVVLRDAAGPITAGDGCLARADGSAACAGLNADLRLHLDAGDGDDAVRATVDAVGVAYAAGGPGDDTLAVDGAIAVLDGGRGDDRLSGSDGYDQLTGGEGDDELRGGDGPDLLSGGLGDDLVDGGAGDCDRALYERRDDMRVDLRAGTGGHGAERDRIVAVERISSARGDDRILGSDRADTLSGGIRGSDLLDGRGGDDVLFGNGVTRVMRGGAGDDRINNGAKLIDAGPGDDLLDSPTGTVRCGPGTDLVRSIYEWRRTVVHGDCERISLGWFHIWGLRRDGRALRLSARARGVAEREPCGTVVAIESGGRRLAQRHLPALAGGRAATLVLRAPRPLPRRLTVALTDATCDRSGRLRPGGARWAERVEVIPLRAVARVG